MPSKVWDKITNPFPNFNKCIVEIWELISNFIPRITMEKATLVKHVCESYSMISITAKVDFNKITNILE